MTAPDFSSLASLLPLLARGVPQPTAPLLDRFCRPAAPAEYVRNAPRTTQPALDVTDAAIRTAVMFMPPGRARTAHPAEGAQAVRYWRIVLPFELSLVDDPTRSTPQRPGAAPAP